MPFARKRKRPSFRRKTRPAKFRRTSRSTRKYPRRTWRRRFRFPKQMGTIIPQKALCKFKCSDLWTLSNTNGNAPGSSSWKGFYANNPYDPVVGVSTTKCSGFDQMMSIYKYGVVHACKVVCYWETGAGENSHFLYSRFYDHNSTPAIITCDELFENNNYTRYVRALPTGHSKPEPILKHFARIKYIEKVKQLDPTTYAFQKTGNPTIPVGCVVGLCSPLTTFTGVWNDTVQVRITYYCKVWERVNMDL